MDETNCPCEKITPSMINHTRITCDPKTQETNSENTLVLWTSGSLSTSKDQAHTPGVPFILM